MFSNILSEKQLELLPLLKNFSKEYFLVGGTAIALQIGHRRSIDFDLFITKKIKRKQIKSIIEKSKYQADKIIFAVYDQMHFLINTVKVTFFEYEFPIKKELSFENIIKIPDLLELGTMKIYALGRRAKWKDYVDLYFILKNHFSLNEIIKRTKTIFGPYFNEKLLREKLSYFDDIDYSEKIKFVNEKIDEKLIKNFLINIVTSPL